MRKSWILCCFCLMAVGIFSGIRQLNIAIAEQNETALTKGYTWGNLQKDLESKNVKHVEIEGQLYTVTLNSGEIKRLKGVRCRDLNNADLEAFKNTSVSEIVLRDPSPPANFWNWLEAISLFVTAISFGFIGIITIIRNRKPKEDMINHT